MDRMACVELPAFPLQLLVARHPDWVEHPVVVVDQDKPQGKVLWLNEAARRSRILPGMRYATGLSLTRQLRAGVVPDDEIASAIRALRVRLSALTPEVEAFGHEPGVFWLGGRGLEQLFTSWRRWGDEIRRSILGAGFQVSVAVGFTRFGTYASVKTRPADPIVFESRDAEAMHVQRVPIVRLSLDPELRDHLLRLGVTTLGRFLSLPPNGIRRRFGVHAYRLQQLANDEIWSPVRADPIEIPTRETWSLSSPECDRERLILVVERLLEKLLTQLDHRGHVLESLAMTLRLDDGTDVHEALRPAEPTLDLRQVVHLVRLRLEGLTLEVGVVDVAITVRGVAQVARQLPLYVESPPRDLDAANRALARVRAQLGDDAITVAVTRDGHLPEAVFDWTPLGQLVGAAPASARGCLVRRLHDRPRVLPFRTRHESDGWRVAGIECGPVEEVLGPHVISGGWWIRRVERAYHYVRTAKGCWLWVFEDRERGRWYEHGVVG